MERFSSASTSRAATFLAAALLCALFAVNLYRAATQSITTDEAFTYKAFVAPSLPEMAQVYDANNHVLYTLTAKISIALFGLSEFTLRLPSVVAGAFYFLVAWRLARRWLGESWLFLMGVALLSLNPMLLDFLSAARGYGMATTFWLWALEFLCRRRLYAAGIALGLAIAANLTMLFPALALVMAFAASSVRRERPLSSAIARLVEELLLPVIVVDFVLLLLPLQAAAPNNFYYGATSLTASFSSLFRLSFVHGAHRQEFNGLETALMILTVMVLAAAAWVAIRNLWRTGQGSADSSLTPLAASAVLTLALLAAAHHLAHVPYPLTRTGLYWIPLLTLLSLALVRHSGFRPLTLGALVAGTLVIARYAAELEVSYYGEWLPDAESRQAAQLIRSRAGNTPIRIAVTWPLGMNMDFYRERFGTLNWKEAERIGTAPNPDFYVVAPEDHNLLPRLHLRPLHRGEYLLVAGPAQP